MVRNIVSFSGLKKNKNKIKDANCNIILKRRCSILVAQLFDYFYGAIPSWSFEWVKQTKY